ncbi:MAG: hypothetical protein FH759_03200 [Sediminimonas qiaohouensis]|uniref:Lipoprotein n=1 Tax=Sediminimonas qiaohouensis TaxID=552061 RepID=A0A7C9HA45_9RHOB|nr:hypothetical protein [Sediminimonas qiaohouensis]MTJ03690.1 hypothetical protein [Sediminimonas qiaohouensis]
MRLWLAALCAMTLASGCAVKEDPPVSDEAVSRAAYRHDGPSKLTLFTMISNDTGAGAHTSLMINGSQRVVFDPAGSFRDPGKIVVRDDVVYGMTPQLADVYTRFHARKTYHVQVQEVDVPAETAEQALQLAMSYGEVPDAQCSVSTSRILAKLNGLGTEFQQTWFPKKLAEQFAEVPGVSSRTLYEYDDADRFKALRAYDPDEVAAQVATKDEG